MVLKYNDMEISSLDDIQKLKSKDLIQNRREKLGPT